MSRTLDEVDLLFDKLYVIFGKLHKNADLMNPKQVDFMSSRLYDLGKEEYTRIYLRNDIENRREDFKINERRSKFIPRRWRAWWSLFILVRRNKPAKLITEEISIAWEKFFAELEKKLEEARQELPAKADTAEAEPAGISRKIGKSGATGNADPKTQNPKNREKGSK